MCSPKREQAPACEHGAACGELHAQQTVRVVPDQIRPHPDVESNPPGIVKLMNTRKVITVLITPQEEPKWQRQFNQLLKAQ